MMIFWAVHNFGLKQLAPQVKSRIRAVFRSNLEQVHAALAARSLWAMGDWDFLGNDDLIFSTRSPTSPHAHRSNEETKLWKDLLGQLTLLHSPDATHFWSGQFSTLDRIYTSTPNRLLQQLSMKLDVRDSP